MKRLRILTLLSILLSAGIFLYKKKQNPVTIPSGDGLVISKQWLKTKRNPQTPIEFCRPADQTFLTFPEWYLVFSPEEQAHYFKNHTATSFPYMSHVSQIWGSYGIVKNQIRGNFPPNNGYHFMIWVIGSSATAEYSIKAWYETVFGRLTDTGNVLTAEDQFDADFTQQYVDFIKDRPWYEFDFHNQLNNLWTNVPLTGNYFIRKAERRYILTSELLVKWMYGKLIGLGTATVYDKALPSTAVLVAAVPQNPEFSIIKTFPDQSALLSLPRYDKFASAISDLAEKGFVFREIAGNDSAILLTILIPAGEKLPFENAKIVFTQPVASDLTTERVAIAIPVKNLNKLLIRLKKENVAVEHVFDF